MVLIGGIKKEIEIELRKRRAGYAKSRDGRRVKIEHGHVEIEILDCPRSSIYE